MGDEYQVSPDFRFCFIVFLGFVLLFPQIVFEACAPMLEWAQSRQQEPLGLLLVTQRLYVHRIWTAAHRAFLCGSEGRPWRSGGLRLPMMAFCAPS